VDPTLIQEAPFLFVYQPALLMNGSWGEIVVAFGSALIGITALSAAVAGHMFGPLSWPRRLFFITVSLAAISPHVAVSLATSVVLLASMAWDARQRRPAPAAAVNAATPTDVTGPGPPV
jgi:TRAP-type uncharacterized transport system fused permease subunit